MSNDSPSIQAQVDRLQEQVRDLHMALERMPEQIASVLISAQGMATRATSVAAGSNGSHHPLSVKTPEPEPETEETYSFLLKEETPAYNQRQMGQHITAEAQVQRLTAQLTAAYNRIAALEEQLLAQRINH
jgi:hypothetical protein